jgi:hypothetical protein
VSLIIKYTAECVSDCGGTMSLTELDLTQEPGGKVVIDLDLLGDMTIECDTCNTTAFVPNLSDYIEEVE